MQCYYMGWYKYKTKLDFKITIRFCSNDLFLLKCHNTIIMYILKQMFHIINMETIIFYLYEIATLIKEVMHSEWCDATITLRLLFT